MFIFYIADDIDKFVISVLLIPFLNYFADKIKDEENFIKKLLFLTIMIKLGDIFFFMMSGNFMLDVNLYSDKKILDMYSLSFIII